MIVTGDRVTLVVDSVESDGTPVLEGAAGMVIGWKGPEVVVAWEDGRHSVTSEDTLQSIRRLPRGRKRDDTRWCGVQGREVPLTECHTGCAAPEQQAQCFMATDAFFARVG